MQIFKLLPRTNCRDCGAPSCLAFAMKVAAGKADYKACSHISQDSSTKLEEMMEPPIKKVILERQGNQVTIGDEKVLFRHDETFYNPTALAVLIPQGLKEDELKNEISKIENLSFNRAGQDLKPDMIALEESSKNTQTNLDFFNEVYKNSSFPLLIKFRQPETLKSFISDKKDSGVICFPDFETEKISGEILNLLTKNDFSVALSCKDRQEAENAGKLFKENHVKNGIIALDCDTISGKIELLTTLRKEAIVKRNRSLGYPALVWPQSKENELNEISTAIMKYGSVGVISSTDPAFILPLLTLRQNIFTDPRRPIQVESKIYEFGNADPNSPLMITTNFSLTYFTVAGEIEASRIPAYLLIVDTDGTSVLTAWSSDRFNAKKVVDFLKQNKIEEIVSHNTLIIPGYVSSLKEDIEEISSWKIIPGPRESIDIPKFLREYTRKK